MAHLLPEHSPVFVQSLGAVELNITNTVSLGHREQGTELVTLRFLWNYCNQNEDIIKIVYLHSKGSFTQNDANDDLRRFLTAGALSQECANVADKSCNVCSSRFSPIPHPHTPGNMWLATCAYVRKLKDPHKFEGLMYPLVSNCENRMSLLAACDGRKRFSAEHWIHSHPSVRPCDLHRDPRFTWGYTGIPPKGRLDIKIARAPRFDLLQYINWDDCLLRGVFLDHRLNEYRELYNEPPGESWWGWNILQTDRSFIPDTLTKRQQFKWKHGNVCWKGVKVSPVTD